MPVVEFQLELQTGLRFELFASWETVAGAWELHQIALILAFAFRLHFFFFPLAFLLSFRRFFSSGRCLGFFVEPVCIRKCA